MNRQKFSVFLEGYGSYTFAGKHFRDHLPNEIMSENIDNDVNYDMTLLAAVREGNAYLAEILAILRSVYVPRQG